MKSELIKEIENFFKFKEEIEKYAYDEDKLESNINKENITNVDNIKKVEDYLNFVLSNTDDIDTKYKASYYIEFFNLILEKNKLDILSNLDIDFDNLEVIDDCGRNMEGYVKYKEEEIFVCVSFLNDIPVLMSVVNQVENYLNEKEILDEIEI